MFRRLIIGFFIAASLSISVALACGPFVTDLLTVRSVVPAHVKEFAAGDIGVVKPRYARAYLANAYRVINGGTPVPLTVTAAGHYYGDVDPVVPRPPVETPVAEWARKSAPFADADKPPPRFWVTFKGVPGGYESFDNCLDDAFTNASRALDERISRYGPSSPNVREWARAQMVVFRNCDSEELQLPDQAPPTAEPLIQADRDYQIAAAYFYAMQYDEAEKRFRAIARDAASPWRIYGTYLAARSLIRKATLAEERSADSSQWLAQAQTDLRQILNDTQHASLHQSARGLLQFIEAYERPIDRLRAASIALTSSPTVSEADLTDYRRMMDALIGDTVDYKYDVVANRAEMIRDNDLVDWVLALQGTGQSALDRAVERWRSTNGLTWLVAVLWKVPAEHPAAADVLAAAQAVPNTSPAFATVAFLRVRLLAKAGRVAEARKVLASLPREVGPGALPETLNLLRAQRLRLAETFEELLANAARTSVGEVAGQAVFDDDAGDLFTYYLPMTRLVEAASAPVLPQRLRTSIAGAALARAIVLRRDVTGVAAATVLKELVPSLRADLDRYISAADAEQRHRAGVLLMLRTPGLRAFVLGLEDDLSADEPIPSREFEHVFRRNWWCVAKDGRIGFEYQARSDLFAFLGLERLPPPAFLSSSELATAEEELQQLRKIGPARDYLTSEAITWARARPGDLNAAEALALAVQGGRWTCGDGSFSHRAFETLHRLFPKSEWARRTRYWYR